MKDVAVALYHSSACCEEHRCSLIRSTTHAAHTPCSVVLIACFSTVSYRTTLLRHCPGSLLCTACEKVLIHTAHAAHMLFRVERNQGYTMTRVLCWRAMPIFFCIGCFSRPTYRCFPDVSVERLALSRDYCSRGDSPFVAVFQLVGDGTTILPLLVTKGRYCHRHTSRYTLAWRPDDRHWYGCINIVRYIVCIGTDSQPYCVVLL